MVIFHSYVSLPEGKHQNHRSMSQSQTLGVGFFSFCSFQVVYRSLLRYSQLWVNKLRYNGPFLMYHPNFPFKPPFIVDLPYPLEEKKSRKKIAPLTIDLQ